MRAIFLNYLKKKIIFQKKLLYNFYESIDLKIRGSENLNSELIFHFFFWLLCLSPDHMLRDSPIKLFQISCGLSNVRKFV